MLFGTLVFVYLSYRPVPVIFSPPWTSTTHDFTTDRSFNSPARYPSLVSRPFYFVVIKCVVSRPCKYATFFSTGRWPYDIDLRPTTNSLIPRGYAPPAKRRSNLPLHPIVAEVCLCRRAWLSEKKIHVYLSTMSIRIVDIFMD